MERRMLAAIVLSVVAMFAWLTLFKRPAPKPQDGPPAAAPGEPAPAAMAGDPSPAPVAGPAAPPAPGAPPPAPAGPKPVQDAPHREFTKSFAKGEFLDCDLTTRGGAIQAIRLRNKFEMCARDRSPREPIDVLLPVEPDSLTGMILLDADPADAEGLHTLDWTEGPASDDRVSFSFVTTKGLKIVKTFVFPTEPERYDVELTIDVERVSGEAVKEEVLSLRLLGAAGLAKEPSSHTSIDEASRATIFVAGHHDDPEFHPAGITPVDLDAPEVAHGAFRFVGIQSPYFFAAVFCDGGADAPKVRRAWAVGGDTTRDAVKVRDRLGAWIKERRGRVIGEDREAWERLRTVADHFQTAWVTFDGAVGTSAAPAARRKPFHLYAGPLSRNVFADDRYRAIANVITYPMAPDWLARLLLGIFDLFKSLTGKAGLAVIGMTLAVRGGLMPLSIKNQLSMRRHGRKVAKLKPRLEQLKSRYANDPRKFREEQVKLFREHGVGFPMGCIMMLLQIPIFFSLFAALRIEFDLRHEAFLWIRDLSGPDRLFDFGLSKGLSLIGIPPGGGISALNVLPLLYMALAIYQQRLMPKAMDEQQAQQMKMAKWMAIIFPVLLYNYTAALALYMCFSSIIAIIEGRIVRAKDAADIAAAA